MSDVFKSAVIVLVLIVSIHILLNNMTPPPAASAEKFELQEGGGGGEKGDSKEEEEKEEEEKQEAPVDELYDFVYKSPEEAAADPPKAPVVDDEKPLSLPVAEFEAFNTSDGNFGTWS